MPNAMDSYQQYILSASAIQGSMDWSSLNIDMGCPVGGDIYALCPSDSFWARLVTNFTPKMRAKANTVGKRALGMLERVWVA